MANILQKTNYVRLRHFRDNIAKSKAHKYKKGIVISRTVISKIHLRSAEEERVASGGSAFIWCWTSFRIWEISFLFVSLSPAICFLESWIIENMRFKFLRRCIFPGNTLISKKMKYLKMTTSFFNLSISSLYFSSRDLLSAISQPSNKIEIEICTQFYKNSISHSQFHNFMLSPRTGLRALLVQEILKRINQFDRQP